MKLYEAAKKEVGHMSCPQDREEELFRLGMLAAADIAWSELDQPNDAREYGRSDAAAEIRFAADV